MKRGLLSFVTGVALCVGGGNDTFAVSPTGGTITTDGNYTVHTFTTSGTFTTYNSGNVELLVVGGGGAGGHQAGGGGGGGGYRAIASHPVTAQTYTVTVGLGGAGVTNDQPGNNGGSSTFDTITSPGGGGGGSYTGSPPNTIYNGQNGASGGGVACYDWNGTPGVSTGYGNNGGDGAWQNPYSAGGGGGAGAVGGTGSTTKSGDGGVGAANDISGTSLYYAGGGGGSSHVTLGSGKNGVGGSGVGGDGNEGDGTLNGRGHAGMDGRGGGGGGSYHSGSDLYGGDGGDGVVIIRYLTSDFVVNTPPSAFSLLAPSTNTSTNNNTPTFSWGISTDPESQPITYTLKISTTATMFTATGGTVTYTDSSGLNPRSSPPYSGGYTVHTFTGSGTFTPTESGNVDYLVIGGGGAGGCSTSGSHYSGGGGAGGYKTGTGFEVAAGSYTITVGNGGAPFTGDHGGNGTSSVFSTITAAGGGGGGGFDGLGTAEKSAGKAGGSGGGSSAAIGGAGGAASPSGQGNAGGAGTGNFVTEPCAGGGGGGAASAGQTTTNIAVGGNGGAGYNNSISGTEVGYAGGGGGASNGSNGTASHGGSVREVWPTANTGGGGGAGTDGATGIVIIRYLSGSVYTMVSNLSGTSYTPGVEEPIADGIYYWKVIASDGVMETASTTRQLTVDTQKPVTPMMTSFSNWDVLTGTIGEIKGTGENGTTLAFYDKNNNLVSGTIDWTGGNFTFTPTTPLDPGSSIYVTSADTANNTSQSTTHVISFEDVENVFKDIAVYHGTGPGSSVRMEKDTSYEFDLAVNAGEEATVRAWLKYNSEYDGSLADAPRITLSGLGITTGNTAAMTAPASYTPDTWEELTVTGTPNAQGVVTLKVETFSTAAGSSAWIDDITISQ